MVSMAKRIFLIVCCLVLLSLGVISLFEQQFIRGIIKIVFAGMDNENKFHLIKCHHMI